MAILNYSKTYQEVLTDLGVTNLSNLEESNTGSYVKLFFTGQGDIITHGKNYTPLFNVTTTGKGLVPSNFSNNVKEILRGDATWTELATSDLPIWKPEDVVYDTTKILDAFTVKQMVDASFAANDAMRFKGVITDLSQLPTEWEAGDTYRIGIPGNYFGSIGEVGDLLICVTTGNTESENYQRHWTVVQRNIDGVLTVKVNGANLPLYTNNGELVGNSYDIYGPKSGGSQNQILVGALSTSGAPEWASVEGLTISGNQNSRKITLNKASSDTLGGVSIDGLGNYTSGGKVTSGDTISITNTGAIYLTPTNIANALGFMPTNPEDLQDALTRADSTKDGLTPMFNAPLGEFNNASWLLGVNASKDSATYGWYTLPETAFKDTWRKILIGGIDIEDSELHLNPSGDICVEVDKDPSEDIVSISFGLSWWNISDECFEKD